MRADHEGLSSQEAVAGFPTGSLVLAILKHGTRNSWVPAQKRLYAVIGQQPSKHLPVMTIVEAKKHLKDSGRLGGVEGGVR
ncbi:hypothetical protein P7K49_018582 [Saguinus oedipus]|uniref:Uncharacterized protein n=1 Tax=Saguinus oedipus TaxID=9490 RepID=A0ABQ9V5S4_SAGOE|nr:hypothetical protein P7K49_018582 [Saguinus oedipus]